VLVGQRVHFAIAERLRHSPPTGPQSNHELPRQRLLNARAFSLKFWQAIWPGTSSQTGRRTRRGTGRKEVRSGRERPAHSKAQSLRDPSAHRAGLAGDQHPTPGHVFSASAMGFRKISKFFRPERAPAASEAACWRATRLVARGGDGLRQRRQYSRRYPRASHGRRWRRHVAGSRLRRTNGRCELGAHHLATCIRGEAKRSVMSRESSMGRDL
jgi:hypothetical protein